MIMINTLNILNPLKASPLKMQISSLAGIFVILSLLLSVGCVKLHVGFDFPEDQVQSIQLGKTTKEEIRKTFGEPWRIGLENGLETWTYGKYTYSGSTETSAKDPSGRHCLGFPPYEP